MPDDEVETDPDEDYGHSMISHAGGALGTATGPIISEDAPEPVGAYAHAFRIGKTIYVSGTGPRDPATNEIPGGPIHDEEGNPLDYDIRAQTRAVIENIETILEGAGSNLGRIIDCLVFLVDMERDFDGYNEVYNEYFADILSARTTVAVSALPTPIAVEFKVIARVE